MNNHRLKKPSTVHRDSRSTIKAQETRFFESIERKRASVPGKQTQLKKITEEIRLLKERQLSNIDLAHRHKNIRKINELTDTQTALHNEIVYILSGREELEYHKKFATFMMKEIDDKEPEPIPAPIEPELTEPETNEENMPHFKKTGCVTAGEKYDNYMAACFGHIIRDTEQEKARQKIGAYCEYCKDQPLIIESSTATAICPECAVSIHWRDDTTNPEYREGVQIISPYAYKRINHFKEWLAQLQAKESTEIPETVFTTILLELKKQRITESRAVTSTKLRTVLKKLRLNKYYEHIPTIIQRITGRSAPSLSPELEARLISMFREIQEPFAKWVKEVAPERKNFLSYSYTLNKMCRILGEYELIQYFPLLKSRDKNYIQDKIWEGICSDLGWEFNKSV